MTERKPAGVGRQQPHRSSALHRPTDEGRVRIVGPAGRRLPARRWRRGYKGPHGRGRPCGCEAPPAQPVNVLTLIAAAVLVRQCFVLAAIVGSARFLRAGRAPVSGVASDDERGPTFLVVVPMLRETAIVGDAVPHFQAMTEGHTAQLVVVTTAREAAEESAAEGAITTGTIVEGLAAAGKLVHLHYPDPNGIKADQVNYAADYCAATLLGDVAPSKAFVVVYDADSRPPLDSLARFEHAIDTHSDVSAFHQSSAFELRAAGRAQHWLAAAGRLICDGGALRANRFVTGFEIPRLLNRSAGVPRYKRSACSYVYAHVTGHGLCVRLSLLRELPLPPRSPLEDMHWSFRLGTRNVPMIAIPSLDVAEVPDRPVDQVRQTARWFFGPGRSLLYLRDPTIQPGWRARILASSAMGSAAEWLACAVIPPFTLAAVILAEGALWGLAIAVATAYLVQLLVTEAAVGARDPLRRRLARIAACPVATVLFGIGGFVGAARLLKGGSGVGKTERR